MSYDLWKTRAPEDQESREDRPDDEPDEEDDMPFTLAEQKVIATWPHYHACEDCGDLVECHAKQEPWDVGFPPTKCTSPLSICASCLERRRA